MGRLIPMGAGRWKRCLLSVFAPGKQGEGAQVPIAHPGPGTQRLAGSQAARPPQQTFLVCFPNAKHSENALNTNAGPVGDGSDYSRAQGGAAPRKALLEHTLQTTQDPGTTASTVRFALTPHCPCKSHAAWLGW